jgi:hypothetical protein
MKAAGMLILAFFFDAGNSRKTLQCVSYTNVEQASLAFRVCEQLGQSPFHKM